MKGNTLGIIAGALLVLIILWGGLSHSPTGQEVEIELLKQRIKELETEVKSNSPPMFSMHLKMSSLKLLTLTQIRLLYHTKVQHSDDGYQQKYKNMLWRDLLLKPVLKTLGPWEGRDVPRVFAVLDFAEWIEKYNISSPDRLLILNPELSVEERLLSPKEVYNFVYDWKREFGDLHILSQLQTVVKKPVDLIVIGQVMEHLYNPLLCLQNLYTVMKPGGYLFTSVPTHSIPHMTPVHYYHYTPMGLAAIATLAGFEVVESGFWGSSKYSQILSTTEVQYWPDYRELGPRVNNSAFHAVQTWILVRKPF